MPVKVSWSVAIYARQCYLRQILGGNRWVGWNSPNTRLIVMFSEYSIGGL
jgi:hypothetical protein